MPAATMIQVGCYVFVYLKRSLIKFNKKRTEMIALFLLNKHQIVVLYPA